MVLSLDIDLLLVLVGGILSNGIMNTCFKERPKNMLFATLLFSMSKFFLSWNFHLLSHIIFILALVL
jgi:hypothetical protein